MHKPFHKPAPPSLCRPLKTLRGNMAKQVSKTFWCQQILVCITSITLTRIAFFFFFWTNAAPSEDRCENCFSVLGCSVILVTWSSFWLSNEQAYATSQNRTAWDLCKGEQCLLRETQKPRIHCSCWSSFEPSSVYTKSYKSSQAKFAFWDSNQDVKYFVLGFYYLFMDFLSVTIRLRPYYLSINMPIFFWNRWHWTENWFLFAFCLFQVLVIQSWPTTGTCASQGITAGVSWEWGYSSGESLP